MKSEVKEMYRILKGTNNCTWIYEYTFIIAVTQMFWQLSGHLENENKNTNVGYATSNDSTTNELHNKQFTSITLGRYN
jgi:hypothetical protein